MPLVSIIIPSYGPSRFLRETIDSVVAQTFKDWELLIVDDGSPDDVSWISKEYPFVTFIEQNRLGVSTARNRGVIESSGDFISFLDHDDVWKPSKLATQVQALHEFSDAAMTFCELDFIDEHSKQISGNTSNQTNVPFNLISFKNKKYSALHESVKFFNKRFVVPSTVMFRRSAIPVAGLLDPMLPVSGDFDFIIKLSAHYPIVHTSEREVLYRRHSQNLSLQYEKCEEEVHQLAVKYSYYAASVGDTRLAKEAASLFRLSRRTIAAQAFDRARLSFREKSSKDLSRHLMVAATADPLFVTKSIIKWCSSRVLGAEGSQNGDN